MSDTPTPAPALTDEQIDQLVMNARVGFIIANTDDHGLTAFDTERYFNLGIAAVVARAKREERERIETRAKAIQCAATGDFGDGWNAALRALVETSKPGATR